MFESIILVLFILSFGGALFILARKIPAINSLPYNGTAGIRRNHFFANIEGEMGRIIVLFKKQILLHKILSWVKVMTLKIERHTDIYLHKIRKEAQEIEKEKINSRKRR